MMRPAIYDDNKRRPYPFLREEATDTLPTEVLVDCSFDFAAYAGFLPGQTSVWLSRIQYDSTTVTLEFSTDAAELESVPLVFVAQRNSSEFQTILSSADAVFPDGSPCEEQLAWFGFVVVADCEALVSFATSSNMTLAATGHNVEPALLRTMEDSYVRSVSVANRERTKVTDTAETEKPYLVHTTCLQGPLAVGEGRNCRISVSESQNALLFDAAIGAGLGEVCDEVPQTPDEEPPSGSQLLTGGPTCSETIRIVNGLTGPVIGVRGGPGINVARDANNPSRLYVSLKPSTLPKPVP